MGQPQTDGTAIPIARTWGHSRRNWGKLTLAPPASAIEVRAGLADRIPCSVPGIFGNEDQNPSPTDVDDLASALDGAGVAYEFHRYDGAGYGFQEVDAWEKIFGLFDARLK